MIQTTTQSKFIKNSFIFLSIFFLFPLSSFRVLYQSVSYEDVVAFEETEEIPVFKGCDQNATSRKEAVDCFNQKMMTHIKRNFSYPEEALENNIQGRIDITFIINDSGLIKNITAKSSNSNLKDQKVLIDEAVRIIGLLPKFSPGKHRGKIVSVKYGVPITFKLG